MELVKIEQESFVARIYPHGEGFVLVWNDYAVNEWVERFTTLPQAIARLALLVQAVESDRGFTKWAGEFASDAEAWFDSQLNQENEKVA